MHRMQLIDGVWVIWGSRWFAWHLSKKVNGTIRTMYIYNTYTLLYMAHITFLLFAIRTNHRVTLRYTYLSHKIVFFTCNESHHIYACYKIYNRSPDGCWDIPTVVVYMFLVVANFPVFFLENFMEHKPANTTFYVMIYTVIGGWEGGMNTVFGVWQKRLPTT